MSPDDRNDEWWDRNVHQPLTESDLLPCGHRRKHLVGDRCSYCYDPGDATRDAESGLPPIHLTGDAADRMTPAEREATIARIREQQPSLQPRCKVCGEGMQFLGIRNMICPRASEHPEPSPSERVKAHRSKREAMYGPTRNKDADAEPYVEQPETTPERMCTSGAVSGPKETIPDMHRTDRDDPDDVASSEAGISPNGTVQDLAPQEPTSEDSYPPESALPIQAAHIILSRTNVEALLHMLDNRDKERPALVKGEVVVEVQEDGEHYQGRTPGVMSWRTK